MSAEIYDRVQTRRKTHPPPRHNADVAIKQQPTLEGGSQELQPGDTKYSEITLTMFPSESLKMEALEGLFYCLCFR